MIREGIYGLLAEFDTPGGLAHAAERAHAEGYRKMDAFTPYPIEEISEAIGFRKNYVALACLIGGILGGLGGYLLQYLVFSISYPINVGGNAFHSWPGFLSGDL